MFTLHTYSLVCVLLSVGVRSEAVYDRSICVIERVEDKGHTLFSNE